MDLAWVAQGWGLGITVGEALALTPQRADELGRERRSRMAEAERALRSRRA